MRIDIKNKQPVPAVYNVKQFSDAAYRFVFYVPLNELPDENIVLAAVKTINFTKELDIEVEGSTLVLEWRPDINETKYAGKFDIQLVITGENYVWQSYKAAYIVSSSVADDPLIYVLSGGITERLETCITQFALEPNVVMTDNGWEWTAGAKTFKAKTQAACRNFIKAENSKISVYTKQFVTAEDMDNIAENLTELLKLNGEQLYYVSLSDFSAGLTTLSPAAHNKTISVYTEDMYKCRCLKGTQTEVFKINFGVNGQTKTAEVLFDDKYGLVFRQDTNGVKVYKKYDGEEYEDIIFKVYQSEEEAGEDAENMPDGSVGIIRS